MAKGATSTGDAIAHVALMRGINVGGNNILPMKELAVIFVEAGCDDVRTYIQSGNVVFRASPKTAARVPELVAAAVKKRFGLHVPVVVRTVDDLRALVGANPFLAKAKDDTSPLHVAFLADAPGEGEIAALDPQRSPPDAYEVRGRDIYMHLPHGAGSTKLTNAYFDSKLRTISTGRNWRTVLKLLELTEALGSSPATTKPPAREAKSARSPRRTK